LGFDPCVGLAQSTSPASRRVREVVALINSATPRALAAYVDTAFDDDLRARPMEANVGYFLGKRELTGGLQWIDVQDDSVTVARVLLTQKLTGEPTRFEVRTETRAPFRVSGIFQLPPSRNVGATGPRVSSDAEIVFQLRDYVNKLARADVFSGTVLLAKDGKVLYSAAFGQANKDFGAPNKVDTKFNLGSMNKMFTSVTIAQLVEQGKLSYDDPLAKFILTIQAPRRLRRFGSSIC